MSNNNMNDAVNKAKQAAEKAQEYSNRSQTAEEREKRIRRDKERNNMPLISQQTNNKKNSTSGKRKRPQTRPHNKRQVSGYKDADQTRQVNMHEAYPNVELAQDGYSKNIYGRTIAVILIIISLVTLVTMWLYNILPFKIRLIITASLIILAVIVYVLSSKGRYSKSTRVAGSTIGTITVVILSLITYLLFTGIGFLDSLHFKTETVEFEIRVMENSPLQEVAELHDGNFAIASVEKEENLEQALEIISKENNVSLNVASYGNYIDTAGSLYSGETDAMLFNRAYIDSLAQAYPEFEQETRVLGTTDISIEVKVKQLVKSVNTSKDSFNMYISGIDTYGDISTVSRSDVNIIMTVNPTTKTILLTSIPRDTYLPIYGTQGSDKLTHAGIYGIESSIGTISQFIETDINYYTRVNFTSLIELVDLLGGIEIENPEEFSTTSYYFPQGTIYLNGDEALAFSRERYNLAEGDIGRGKNQLRVIEGMVKKATSPAILSQANELMDRFNEVAETNMPAKDISNLINVQLSDNSSWNFEKMTLDGYGSQELPSYAMPGQALYMYVPDQESANTIRLTIDEVMRKK